MYCALILWLASSVMGATASVYAYRDVNELIEQRVNASQVRAVPEQFACIDGNAIPLQHGSGYSQRQSACEHCPKRAGVYVKRGRHVMSLQDALRPSGSLTNKTMHVSAQESLLKTLSTQQYATCAKTSCAIGSLMIVMCILQWML